MIRVVIADDHPVFRRGLCGVLGEADDIEVVGEADNGATAIARAVESAADVVVMDLAMVGVGGLSATRQLAESGVPTAVLVLTMSSDEATVHAALRAGARGYLVKGAGGDVIVSAVRCVASGGTYLGAEVAAPVLARVTTSGLRSAGPFPVLTDRELEILDLVARGYSNAAIAKELVLSDKTVRNHVSNVFGKLGVTDRPKAIVAAREAGLGR
jgi:DNA-binding NarL/FixJ family response regulator